MSFSFDFSGDDISDSELEQTATTFDRVTISQPQPTSIERLPLESVSKSLIPPKRHSLKPLLQTLPSQLTFNYVHVPISNTSTTSPQNKSSHSTIRVPRRSLFDIRQQLMAESDPTSESDTTSTLLSGLETGDLSTGIYEGGFKTWECAVDLAGYVASSALDVSMESRWGERMRVIELGAGSAIPSLVLLRQALTHKRSLRNGSTEQQYFGPQRSKQGAGIKFTICDYNEDVLRLCTAANIFLTTMLAVSNGKEVADMEDDDIDVDEERIDECLKALEDAGVEIDFVSGGWGSEFTNITCQNEVQDAQLSSRGATLSSAKTLILASETIYSPDSLPVFTQTILNLLKLSKNGSQALVAAKRVYFGVGGGVVEFEGELRKMRGKAEVVHDIDHAGVGRVIFDVKTRG